MPENWPLIRETLKKLGLVRKLLGKIPQHLPPLESRNERQGKFTNKNKPVQFKKAAPNIKQEKSAAVINR